MCVIDNEAAPWEAPVHKCGVASWPRSLNCAHPGAVPNCLGSTERCEGLTLRRHRYRSSGNRWPDRLAVKPLGLDRFAVDCHASDHSGPAPRPLPRCSSLRRSAFHLRRPCCSPMPKSRSISDWVSWVPSSIDWKKPTNTSSTALVNLPGLGHSRLSSRHRRSSLARPSWITCSHGAMRGLWARLPPGRHSPGGTARRRSSIRRTGRSRMVEVGCG